MTVLSGMEPYDLGERPAARGRRLGFDETQLAILQVPGRGPPLRPGSEFLQVFARPSLPQVISHLLKKLPSSQSIRPDIEERRFGEGVERSPDQEVTKGQGAEVLRVIGEGLQWARVKTQLNLCEECRHFFIREPRLADDSPQVVLQRPDSCLPKPAEVLGRRRVELPLYSVVCQAADDVVEVAVGRLEEFLEQPVGAHKISAAVAVDGLTQCDKAAESGEERIRRVVTDYLKVDGAGTKTDKDCQKSFEGLVPTSLEGPEPDGAGEVHAGMQKWSAGGDSRSR
ncbi:hypothetical protein RF55_10045 [Lasius niger]|uniref:Uncharacterized protein n=1 Tax=Lasius niger TaxID=67767 RepID=A0A0J7NCC0_LASNI|nr:hypothetical protein RF55_10045 [Lasius niger]